MVPRRKIHDAQWCTDGAQLVLRWWCIYGAHMLPRTTPDKLWQFTGIAQEFLTCCTYAVQVVLGWCIGGALVLLRRIPGVAQAPSR